MLVMLWSIEYDETWIYVKRCLLLIQKTYDKYFFSSECPAGLVGGVEYCYNHSSTHIKQQTDRQITEGDIAITRQASRRCRILVTIIIASHIV